MSADTPDVPPKTPPTADRHGTTQQPKGGSLGLGVLIGTVSLYGFYVWAAFVPGPAPTPTGRIGAAALIPLAVYLLVSILLAVRRRTSLFGAGLLIGLGVWTLFGGGLCVASLVRAGI